MIVNIFFTFWLGYMSVDCFNEGNDNLGWWCLIFSAANGAAVLASIF